MKAKKTLKAIALSLGLAAMMAPATLDAQINHGLLQNPYRDQNTNRRNESSLRQDGTNITGNEFTNGNFGEVPAPLGSGLFILIGAGLGYVALKKKEDKQ